MGEDEYHGGQARAQLIRNPKNTVANFRDFLGLSYDKIDPTYAHASAHPEEQGGVTGFSIQKNGDAEFVSVKDIATRHFDRLRDAAADFIGKPVDGAVVAVPTNFNDKQRAELTAAATAGGIKVLQIINEPTAALLAHVSAQQTANGSSAPDKLYVVADFGGTRTDGAVIAARGGTFTVLATLHDTEIGGRKLDDALGDYIAAQFEKEHGTDPRTNARSLAKLLAEAETAKKTLSNTQTSNFAVESLADGIDYHTTINRLRFELAARPVFNKFVTFVQDLVKKAELDVLDIDEVLLVGGTSAVPKIASSLSAVFDENTTTIVAPSLDSKALNPAELIARGCAIQASLIAGFDDDEVAESLQPIVTVAPHTSKPIGVQVDGSVVEVIAVDTSLPIRKTVVVSAPDADSALVGVYELESEIVTKVLEKEEKPPADDDESDWSDDDEPEEVREKVVKAGNRIAELGLKGIEPKGKIEVVINITRDLKLQVAARELKAGGVAVRGETPAAQVAVQ